MLTLILDGLALASALAAALLWWKASGNTVRRISLTEEIDAQDFNRIVIAMNRSQLLNRRAALATAVSALAIALKFAHDMVVPG
ncbi:MAG: hypothetical protein MUC44_06390 [Beijerinckiaceae bacterium]|jgi:hypothetical protein|nr:hypothetical protein [Beijerinckiaceae bacterium]